MKEFFIYVIVAILTTLKILLIIALKVGIIAVGVYIAWTLLAK